MPALIPRVVFVCQSLAHPRIARRTQMFLDMGYSVTVYGYERESATPVAFPPEVETVSLGVVPNGISPKRIAAFIRGLMRIRKHEHGRQYHYVMAFLIDTAMLAQFVLYTNVNCFIYEVSDLHFSMQHESIMAKILCKVEDWVIRRSDAITLTSPYFLEEFDRRHNGIAGKAITLENKLPATVANAIKRPKVPIVTSYPVRIGFVGAIRYWEPLEAFAEAISKFPNRMELHLHGYALQQESAERLTSAHSNVYFHGAYSNPDDLHRIYTALDLTYSVYSSDDYNVRVALPNKLYESVFFGVPVLAAEGTALASRIMDWGAGGAIVAGSVDSAHAFLEELSVEKLDAWKHNALGISTDQLIIRSNDLREGLARILPEHI